MIVFAPVLIEQIKYFSRLQISAAFDLKLIISIEKNASKWPSNAMLHLLKWYILTFYDFDRINPEPLVAHKQTINRYLNLEVGQGHETKNLESVNTIGVAILR